VSTKAITIKANKPAGLFYGAQTLLQLLPKEIESDKLAKMLGGKFPV
jgi:hexosaminidase